MRTTVTFSIAVDDLDAIDTLIDTDNRYLSRSQFIREALYELARKHGLDVADSIGYHFTNEDITKVENLLKGKKYCSAKMLVKKMGWKNTLRRLVFAGRILRSLGWTRRNKNTAGGTWQRGD